jgi:hypothetical protein
MQIEEELENSGNNIDCDTRLDLFSIDIHNNIKTDLQ